MFALLPLIGGVLLGRFAPRRAAVAVQIAFFVVSTAALTITAPRHGGSGSFAEVAVFAPVVAVISAAALGVGIYLRRRPAAA